MDKLVSNLSIFCLKSSTGVFEFQEGFKNQYSGHLVSVDLRSCCQVWLERWQGGYDCFTFNTQNN